MSNKESLFEKYKIVRENEEEIEKDKKKIEILNKRINDLSTMKYASIGYMDLNIVNVSIIVLALITIINLILLVLTKRSND